MKKYRVRVREEHWGDFHVEADSAEAAETKIREQRDELGAQPFWLGNWHADSEFEACARDDDWDVDEDCE